MKTSPAQKVTFSGISNPNVTQETLEKNFHDYM